MTDEPTSTLVVDDQGLFRQAIARLLDLQPDFTVVGQAADGREAVEAAERLRPDLVLMDVEMPVLGGIDAAAEIRASLPGTKVVMLTISDDDDFLIAAVRQGVDGYLLKDMTPDALFDGLRSVLAGHSSISPGMVARLFREVREGGRPAYASPEHHASPASTPAWAVDGARAWDGPALPAPPGTPVDAAPARRELLIGDPPLSFRELATMRLVAEGLTNKEIGARLSITEGTVKNHVHNALTKLGMDNRIQAAAYILRHGL